MTLSIRRAGVRDAVAMARHLGDPGVYGETLQLPYPSEESWVKRMTDWAAATNGDTLLVAERDGELIGHVSLAAAGSQGRRRHAAVLGIAVAPEAQGQGVGTALMTAICDYADKWANVLRIELTVFADNAVAIRLYRNFGFETEGTMRAYALRGGEYVDANAMARLHPNPPTVFRG